MDEFWQKRQETMGKKEKKSTSFGFIGDLANKMGFAKKKQSSMG